MIYLQMLDTPEDKSRFVQLYEAYARLMYHVAHKLLDNEADAQDAVHQAFVSVIEHFEKISDIHCPETRSYLVIIVERKAIDILRGRARQSAAPFDEGTTGLTIPLPGNSGLADAMARLPARYRQILLLRFDNGYSTAELAKMLGMNRDSVQKLLWRAKQELKRQLEEVDVS